MLAQIKRHQTNNFVLCSTQRLPETVSSLLESIGYHQSLLHKLLSVDVSPPEKNGSTSLRLFLTELKNRLKVFMLTFDEISVQVLPLNNQNLTCFKPTLSRFQALQPSHLVVKIFSTTMALCEMFTMLEKHLEKSESQFFFKDLLNKSLIFYKQTNVVLKGYLRIYNVQGDKGDYR